MSGAAERSSRATRAWSRHARHAPLWSVGLLALGAASSSAGCSDAFEVGALGAGAAGLPAGGTSGAGGAAGAGGASGAAGAGPCVVTSCLGKVYACGDCVDNDADGLTDALDPDCTGPCDNTEDSFFGGIPGQNNAPCRQDCYFDQDSGSGNDGCDWSASCDPLSVAPSYPPSGNAQCSYDPTTSVAGDNCAALTQAMPQACLDYCLPLTPNGCDCFGCCELPARSGHFVWLGSTENGQPSCDRQHLDDPAACAPCTPVPSCFNPCSACEVCVGSTSPDPNCGGGAPSCSIGTPCDPRAGCGRDAYCITGCCVPVPR